MNNFFKIFIPFVIIGAILYQYQDTIRTQFTPFIYGILTQLGIESSPCTNPIPYTLGTFDTRFGISEKYFLSALIDAEMIWEKPFGKELFDHEKDLKQGDKGGDELKVNLIYDFRQQATSKIADLGIVVNENKASYDALKEKFTALNSDLADTKSDYEAGVQSFNLQEKEYEDKVEYWNNHGGASPQNYKELQAEKSILDQKASELKTLQTKINGMVDEINSLVVVLNRLVTTLNLSVEQYNTIGASRGESFEEGVYTSDKNGQEIDIYEFSSRAKLVRVLAHELGHALGLEHVDDPKAIMYKLNQSSSQILTKADLDALKAKCGAK